MVRTTPVALSAGHSSGSSPLQVSCRFQEAKTSTTERMNDEKPYQFHEAAEVAPRIPTDSQRDVLHFINGRMSSRGKILDHSTRASGSKTEAKVISLSR